MNYIFSLKARGNPSICLPTLILSFVDFLIIKKYVYIYRWNTGLGEMMPLQLWETTLDPETRLLKQLVVDNAAEANVVFSSLMGSRVDARKQLIKNSASMMNFKQLDI